MENGCSTLLRHHRDGRIAGGVVEGEKGSATTTRGGDGRRGERVRVGGGDVAVGGAVVIGRLEVVVQLRELMSPVMR